MHCFYLVPCRGEKYQATPLKQDFGTSYLVGVLFKMSDKHRCPFDFRVPRREGRAVQAKKKNKKPFCVSCGGFWHQPSNMAHFYNRFY